MARLDRFQPPTYAEEKRASLAAIMDEDDAHRADKEALQLEVASLKKYIALQDQKIRELVDEHDLITAQLLEDKRQLKIQLKEKL